MKTTWLEVVFIICIIMIIFEESGIKILEADGTYYLGYEDGAHMSCYWEIEISKEDADKVMQDVKYAIKLVLDYQNKQWGLV